MALPSFGARRSLIAAAEAASHGRLDEATTLLRAYFARRYKGRWRALSRADAEAAMLAATCAAMRGDAAELDGLAELVRGATSAEVLTAQEWVRLLRSALDGDVSTVLDEVQKVTLPALSALVPVVALTAAERAGGAVSPKAAQTLERMLDGMPAPPDVRARLALVIAIAAQAVGDGERSATWLASIPPEAPVLYRFLAAVASDDLQTAAELSGAIAADDRAAAASFVAGFAMAMPPATTERLARLIAPFAPPEAMVAMRCAIARGIARSGAPDRAIDMLEPDLQSELASSIVSTTLATLYVETGQTPKAIALLQTERQPTSRQIALLLLSLAITNDLHALDRELATRAATMPDDIARELATPLLVAIANMSALPADATLPEWLNREPQDPVGRYAWARLKLRQGDIDAASASFDRALAAKPDLADRFDDHDVARLQLAGSALRARDFERAEALATGVGSPRFARSAERVRAFAYFGRATSGDGQAVDAEGFARRLTALRQSVAPGSPQSALLDLLESDALRIRARLSLRDGDTQTARSLLSRDDKLDGDRAFLEAVASLLEGADHASVEHMLQDAIQRDSTHDGANVLLAELRAALHGADEKLGHLEAAHQAGSSSALVAEALAGAYGGANRGLDAKRVGLQQYRTLGPRLPETVAGDIANALSLEAPPPGGSMLRDPNLTRLELGSLLTADGLDRRADMLIARAERAAGSSPALAETISPLAQAFKRSIVIQDEAGALAAEMGILRALHDSHGAH